MNCERVQRVVERKIGYLFSTNCIRKGIIFGRRGVIEPKAHPSSLRIPKISTEGSISSTFPLYIPFSKYY